MAANNSSYYIDEELFGMFNKVSISSAVFLSLVALGTVITNGVALVAIFKDPLKCFRNPMATFITGILVSDFLTGLIVEPVLVTTYVLWMRTDLDIDDYEKIIRGSQIINAVTINTSFLTVLALAVSQLLALRWPSVYNQYVTSPLAILGIVCIWIYAVLFALLPEIANISIEIYFFVDLILHTSLISFSLLIIYVVVFFSFKRAMRRHEIAAEAQQEDENRQEIPKQKVEKEFLVGTFLVILVLIITVWPFTISFYVLILRVFKRDYTPSFWKLYIAFILFDDILHLKFLLDPIIFVWRLSKYREAINIVCAPIKERLWCCFARGPLPRATYHRPEDEGSVEDPVAPEWSTDISGAFIKEVEDEPIEA